MTAGRWKKLVDAGEFSGTKEKLDDIRRARAFSQLFSKDPRAVINREVDFDLSLPFDPAATKENVLTIHLFCYVFLFPSDRRRCIHKYR